MRGPALLSIHDVMPETLGAVRELLALTAAQGIGPVTLLVVPGRAWDQPGLDQLRRWVDAGHELAGHGWCHQVSRIRGLRHRLHSLFVSRDCAEHLALDAAGIRALLARCRAWFPAHGFDAPELYVPPAWALGSIPRGELADTGFTWFETMAGIRHAPSRRMRTLPLLGFEARSRWQVPVLHLSNAVNRAVGRAGPYRIAIHPQDHRLPLAAALGRALAGVRETRCYRELAA